MALDCPKCAWHALNERAKGHRMQSAPSTDDNAALCALSNIRIIRNKNAQIRGIEKLGNIEKTNDPKNDMTLRFASVTEKCSYTDARVYMCAENTKCTVQGSANEIAEAVWVL